MFAAISAASSGAGRITVATPSLSYSGNGTLNNGKFKIVDYNPSLIYVATGGSIAYDNTLGYYTFTVTSSTASGTLICKSPKGFSQSSPATAWRHVADQTNVAYTQCYNPCNDLTFGSPTPGVWNWSCGCGSGCNDSGGGAWGVGICRGPGYTYWNDYKTSGYTWSGTNYTNGQGEWWKIT